MVKIGDSRLSHDATIRNGELVLGLCLIQDWYYSFDEEVDGIVSTIDDVG